ncbi:MAG: hypothetical protein FVQ79_04255 [Planctomycetes bacterium]|nr:hypothetical protein [Planctomycetota bacterium]
MKLHLAQHLAEVFAAALTPFVERVEIAGSIRRLEDEVKDIEIVCLAKLEDVEEKNLFDEVVDTKQTSVTENNLPFVMLDTGWQSGSKDGPRYKRLIHTETKINLDLFIIPDAHEWGAVLLIRTGPAEFNMALMRFINSRQMHLTGNQLHPHSKRWKHKSGEKVSEPCEKGVACPLIIPTPDETAFLEAIGFHWVAPQRRTPEWVNRQAKRVLGLQKAAA